jgi:hypothetical protein
MFLTMTTENMMEDTVTIVVDKYGELQW